MSASARQTLEMSSPWTLSEVRATFVSIVLSVAMLIIGWWLASGTGQVNRQIGAVVLGIAAVVALGIGSFFWLLQGRRAVALRQSQILGRVEATVSAAAEKDLPETDLELPVRLAESNRYHRPSCVLVHGKPVTPASRVRDAGTEPCEMCCP